MDGLLIVINNFSAEYAVTFTANGVGAAASKVRRCQGMDGLQSFLCQIGLRDSTVRSLTDEFGEERFRICQDCSS